MKYSFILLLCSVLVLVQADTQTHQVPEGCFYEDCMPIGGDQFLLNAGKSITQKIQFDENCSNYLFSLDNKVCSSNWNKLFGKSRCMSQHHTDSDRFVWRRLYDSVGIQVAAYAYDKGVKPYPNNPDLLKPFSTQLSVDTYYIFEIDFAANLTTYTLYDESQNFLESKQITHSNCPTLNSLYDKGYSLYFYFGGSCPAPQLVSIQEQNPIN